MDVTECIVRRATLEDLPALKGLWEVSMLPATDLEKRLTEFQVVTRPDGVLLGAVGMRLGGGQGSIHSEAFYQTDQAPELRPILWNRLQVLARNLGMSRLWTRHKDDFWRQAGFHEASEPDTRRLPPAFGDGQSAWLTLALQGEQMLKGSLEQELEAFQREQREESERLIRQANTMKWIVGLIAIGFFLGAAVLLALILRHGGLKPTP